MSADSGFAVFADAAKVEAYRKQNLTYKDLAEPHWLQDDPDLFYGKMYNNYKETQPHEGYQIIKRWRDNYFSSSNSIYEIFLETWDQVVVPEMAIADKYESCDEVEGKPGPFFVYTSNVDAHHQKSGFMPNEIYEIHGCVQEWQCSKPCSNEVWRIPSNFSFQIDESTLRAADCIIPNNELLPDHFKHNHPLCKNCGAPARPRACFFKDLTWIYAAHAHAQYHRWIATSKKILQNNNNNNNNEQDNERKSLRVVILEVGCGILVNSVRMQTRHLREQVFKDSYCHTIRINPDFPNVDDDTVPKDKITGIRGKALEVLRAIDQELSEQRNK